MLATNFDWSYYTPAEKRKIRKLSKLLDKTIDYMYDPSIFKATVDNSGIEVQMLYKNEWYYMPWFMQGYNQLPEKDDTAKILFIAFSLDNLVRKVVPPDKYYEWVCVYRNEEFGPCWGASGSF